MSNTGNPFTSTSNHKENNHVMISRGGEKKVMKKILSVALSTAMAFSMFASVAFGQTGLTDVNAQYNYLKDKGIFAGFPDGQAHLDRQMTRAEFAKVITKTLGLKEVEGVYSFKDKNYGENHWAAPYVEAVYAAGIMEGVNSTKKIFGVSNPVTIQEMATVLVRALDLEVPTETNNSATAWAKGYVQAAINAGLVDANANFQSNATRELLVGAAYAVDQELSLSVESYTVSEAGKVVEFKMTDGETVKVTLDKALEANKETEVKFTYQEKEFTEKVTYVVTEATKVESASATNLKEVVVNFDGKVDEDTATSKANYSLKSGKTIDKVTLSEDQKSVTLYLTGTLTNNKTESVSVSNVKAGDRVVSASNIEFTVSDNQLPEVTNVQSLGTKSVKVVFSEPVNDLKQSNFNLDGKEYFGKVDLGANNKSVILTPYSSSALAVGAHKLTISGVKDFANFVSLSKTVDFTVVEDTTAPTVTTAEATLESVTLTFSEDVDASTVSASNVYWKSGTSKKAAITTPERLADNKYKFYFGTEGNSLPTGSVDIFVEGVKDYSGNQIANNTSVSVTPSIDQTRPEVVRATATNSTTIKLTFSKAVNSASAQTASNYSVTNKDGKVVSVQSATIDTTDNTGKSVIVKLYSALSTGNNTITVKNVKDATKLQNTMLDYTGTVTVGDTVAPELDSETVSANDRRVVLTFNEAMDPASLADYTNYLVHIDGQTRVLTPAIADISVIQDSKAVVITFAETFNNKNVSFTAANSDTIARVSSLSVLAVKDAAGNPLKEFTEGAGNVITISENTTLALASYNSDGDFGELVDRRTVKIKFNSGIVEAPKGAFALNGYTVADVEANGTSVVTVKFTEDLPTDASLIDLTITAASLVTSAGSNGTGTLNIDGSEKLKDSVKPVLTTTGTYAVTNGNEIELTYSEVVSATNPTLAATDFKITRYNDNEVLSAATDYTVTVDGTKTVTITLTDDREVDTTYSIVVDGAEYIVDSQGNAIADSTGTTGSVAVAPEAPAGGEGQ